MEQYIKDLEGIIDDIDEIVESIVLKNKGYILKNVKLRLFNRGRDGSGNLIEPEYMPNTIEYKKSQRQRSSHVTLRDSGDFYRSFVVEYKNNTIFIESNVRYKSELIQKYGEDIFNLTEHEVSNVIMLIIEPEIEKILRKLPPMKNEVL